MNMNSEIGVVSVEEDRLFTVMIVDDSPSTTTLLMSVLVPIYKVEVARSAKAAIEKISLKLIPDLIIINVCMPGLSGHELCAILKARHDTRHIPIVFLTSDTDPEKEREGLELGAVDYLYKPTSMALILARIRNHIAVKVFSDRLREREEELRTQVLIKSAELASLQVSMISALTVMACARDNETGKHILRTQLYIKFLASQLRTDARFSSIIDDIYIEHLYRSAPLHDIGKISIPDRILLKPGRLTPDEFEVMKQHPLLGLEAIEKVQATAADNLDFLSMGKEICFSHHEKWDGSGYPQGLSGEDIPLSARLMALVDVYDAITSRRPYKEPMSHAVAVDLISSSRGTHFDPVIVDAFYKISPIFEKISFLHMDSEQDVPSKYERD